MNDIRIINIITTGGTIEKSYDELDGTLENRTSIIKDKIINRLRLPYHQLNFHPLFAKDSLDMTDEDRRILCRFTQTMIELGHPIIILHGTDTIQNSMAYLEAHLNDISVPVIFTGAMKPIGFEVSDALQNVTEALYATQIAQGGIYLSFHGRLYRGSKVLKNKQKFTFEATS